MQIINFDFHHGLFIEGLRYGIFRLVVSTNSQNSNIFGSDVCCPSVTPQYEDQGIDVLFYKTLKNIPEFHLQKPRFIEALKHV